MESYGIIRKSLVDVVLFSVLYVLENLPASGHYSPVIDLSIFGKSFAIAMPDF